MKKLKTLWLNIGALDRDMDLSGRQQILKALASEDFEVRATFNYIDSNNALIGGIDKTFLFRIKGRLSGFKLMLKQQMLLTKNLDVDFIIIRAWKVHETLPLFFLLRHVFKRKKPYFILDLRTVPVDLKRTIRCRLNAARFKSSIRLALKYFDGLTVISEKLKQDIRSEFKCLDKRISVWTTGVDPEHFNPDIVGNMRNELGISERFVVMYHGIFSPFRGLQQAIKAISILKDDYPDLLLFLLGKGDAELELKFLIDELGLHDNVIVHPPVDFNQVPCFINSADCGILPFPDLEWWNTSGPLKLNEYLAIGKPVVLTDIAAHRAVINDKAFGFYSKNDSPANLAKAIGMAYNETGFPRLSQEARTFALKKLTWASQAKKIEMFFRSVDIDGKLES